MYIRNTFMGTVFCVPTTGSKVVGVMLGKTLFPSGRGQFLCSLPDIKECFRNWSLGGCERRILENAQQILVNLIHVFRLCAESTVIKSIIEQHHPSNPVVDEAEFFQTSVRKNSAGES